MIAHELGHAMGIFHISEPDHAQLESLSDTPTCSVDSNQDEKLNADDCPEATHNLMFWSPKGVLLTPQQRERIQTSWFIH